MKLLNIDIETTGKDPHANGIHWLAGDIEIDGEVIEQFNFRVQPYFLCKINQESLAVSKTTMNDLVGYKPIQEVFSDFCYMLKSHKNFTDPTDKFFICGYNVAAFENPFLRNWFSHNMDNGFGTYFHSAAKDVMVTACDYLSCRGIILTSYSLKNVAKELGVDVDEKRLHDPEYDVFVTKEIHKIVQPCLNQNYTQQSGIASK